MTKQGYRRAERLAPLIAAVMWSIYDDPRVPTPLRGDMQRGWAAGFASRRSVVRCQPPDTIAGWAGWLAAHIQPERGR